MDVRQTKLGVANYLAPDFSLVQDNLNTFTTAVDACRPLQNTHLVIDLQDTPVIDSAALEYLIELATELRTSAGSLRLTMANDICRDILRITGVDDTIPVFNDRESVGRSFL